MDEGERLRMEYEAAEAADERRHEERLDEIKRGRAMFDERLERSAARWDSRHDEDLAVQRRIAEALERIAAALEDCTR